MPFFWKKKEKKEKEKITRLLYIADIHGSVPVFSKLLRGWKIFDVQNIILAGDLSGKAVIPVIQQPDGKYRCKVLGQTWVVDEKELPMIERKINTLGFYPYYTDEDGAQDLLDPKKYDEIYMRLVKERLRDWIKKIEETFKDTGVKFFVSAGNDDPDELREIIQQSSYVVDPEDRVVTVDGHEMISLGWSNPTPWHTPRECSEEELREKIEKLVSMVSDMKGCIFNFHCPPKDTMIDTVAYVDEKTLKMDMRKIVGAGSIAIREAIEKYQPMLGLHGHIHESRGVFRLGRTLLINPGSEYAEGILRGVIVVLEKERVKGYQFVSG